MTRERRRRHGNDAAILPLAGAPVQTAPAAIDAATVLRPSAATPLVLTCEHARPRLPPPIRPSAAECRVLASHHGHDIGAWAVTRVVSRVLEACAVGFPWSRLLIDVNRRAGDPALVRRRVDGRDLSWNVGLDVDGVRRRFEALHVPYHMAIERQVARLALAGTPPLVFSIHSFTPELDGARRRFDVGVLYVDSRGPARRLARALRATGLSVRYNEPYSGPAGLMYSAQRHGTHHGVPYLELELNQALIGRADEARRVGAAVASALRGLLISARGRAGGAGVR